MRTLFAIGVLFAAGLARADDYPERAQDETIVETVLRLENFDLNSSERGKTAVVRYLKHNVGGETFFRLLRKYKIAAANPLLLQLAAERPTETAGVEAARLLLDAGETEMLREAIDRNDQSAANIVTAVGLSGAKRAAELALPLLTDHKRPVAVRSAAAGAVARGKDGHRRLLDLAVAGKLDDDLKFTVGNILRASSDAEIRATAARLLPPPATADEKPLPPLAELARRHGDVQRGHKVFREKGTCIKCHKVRDEGKDIGPNLSEIGDKLTREAMLVAILDPSAGISHNYECYQAILDDGTTFTGLKTSETDEAVTLKSAEGIVRTMAKDEIDELFMQKTSLMPADLQRLMTADELVDVVAFLATLTKQDE